MPEAITVPRSSSSSMLLKIILTVILASLSGLFFLKADNSRVQMAEEDIKENKIKIEKVDDTQRDMQITMERVETVLDRVEKVLDK